MAAIWPPLPFPQVPQVSGSYTFDTSVVRTQVDEGPQEVRRRYTAAVEVFDAVLTLTNADMITFWTFFDTTIAAGSLEFDWTHPLTGAPATMRARTAAPPVFTNIDTGSDGAGNVTQFWRGKWQLEELP